MSPWPHVWDTRAWPRDGAQPLVRGAHVGCGPLSAACLLHVYRPDLAAPHALAADLLAWQRAVRVPLSGGQRATWPWAYLLGLNAYLRAHDLPLRARGRWGVRIGPALERYLARLHAAGQPVVGLEFSLRAQHYGLLRAYQPGPTLRAQLHADGSTLELAPRAGLGGVFWLEAAEGRSAPVPEWRHDPHG